MFMRARARAGAGFTRVRGGGSGRGRVRTDARWDDAWGVMTVQLSQVHILLYSLQLQEENGGVQIILYECGHACLGDGLFVPRGGPSQKS
jgi:hypothetical protein